MVGLGSRRKALIQELKQLKEVDIKSRYNSKVIKQLIPKITDLDFSVPIQNLAEQYLIDLKFAMEALISREWVSRDNESLMCILDRFEHQEKQSFIELLANLYLEVNTNLYE